MKRDGAPSSPQARGAAVRQPFVQACVLQRPPRRRGDQRALRRVPAHRPRPPRRRAGQPKCHPRAVTPGRSSPQARGSAVGHPHLGVLAVVLPAGAGVSRRTPTPRGSRRRPPRRRRGQPPDTHTSGFSPSSSPQARGSAGQPRGVGRGPAVLPAGAGVSRGVRRPQRGLARPPRTRGGPLRPTTAAALPKKSSPRPRGSAEFIQHSGRELHVLPAPAGVSRHPALVLLPAGAGQPMEAGSERSSPHPRGSAGHDRSASRPPLFLTGTGIIPRQTPEQLR